MYILQRYAARVYTALGSVCVCFMTECRHFMVHYGSVAWLKVHRPLTAVVAGDVALGYHSSAIAGTRWLQG